MDEKLSAKTGAVLEKKYWGGGWPLIIWEATIAAET